MGATGLGFGAKFILDAYQTWSQSGLPSFLRIQNADDSGQDFADLGFEVAVTGQLAQQTGTTDILITPPPEVFDLSLHNIGIMGGRLQLGARKFRVSHTFVLAQIALMGYTDQYLVWRDKSRVVGIKYDNRLYSIESVTHEEFGGVTTLWDLICNVMEDPSLIT